MSLDTNQLFSQFEEELRETTTAKEFEELEIKYLGRNGLVNAKLKEIKDLVSDKRKAFGEEINKLKKNIEAGIQEGRKNIAEVSPSENYFDDSLPGKKPHIGHFHPTTLVIRRINSFFRYLGYSVYEGPEIETNEYNFEKLNLPKDHPARELADTLYIQEPEILLRTHTSSVEARAMTQEKLPLRIVVPGKSYRNESVNSTNNAIFYQYEGLVIDKGISMAHLKGTLSEFAKFLYGEKVVTRFRCKYYPQVEPGVGFDIQCTFCGGKGCTVCKYRGFIEALGAGMVHPNVLQACNIDSKIWSGFAFGMGLDRLVMLTYGIDDIRKLYNGSLAFPD